MKAYDYLVANGYAKKREFEEEEISKFLGLSAKDMWNTFMPQLPEEVWKHASEIIGNEMTAAIREDTVRMMLLLRIRRQEDVERRQVAKVTSTTTTDKADEEKKKETTVVKSNKVGRNDPCPCGSGKKYKKCCG